MRHPLPDRSGSLDRWAGRAAKALVVAAMLVLGAASIAAVLVLPVVVATAASGPSALPIGTVLGAAAAVVMAMAVLLVARLSRSRPRAALGVGLALFVVVRVGLAASLDGVLRSDWLAYHRLALGWIAGAPPIADRPMGYPIVLGEAYRIAGTDAWVPELLNLGVATLGVVLLAWIVASLAGLRVAAVAVAVLAIAPGPALSILPRGTETLFTTALIAATGLLVATIERVRRIGPDPTACAFAASAACVLALASLVRPTSLALLAGAALLPFLAAGRRGAAPMAAIVLGAAVVLLPVAALHATTTGRWSPSTSMFIGWQLFVGTNAETGGRWSEADVRRVDAAVGGRPSVSIAAAYAHGIFDPAALRAAAHRDATAGGLALDRIARDWPRIALMLPGKLAGGWGPADAAIDWVLPARPPAGTARVAHAIAAQAWWVAVLVAAVVALRRGRAPWALALVAAALLVPTAVMLLALEVQPRYHEHVIPLVVALAVMAPRHRGVLRRSADPPG